MRFIAALALVGGLSSLAATSDPNLWLEELSSPRVDAWVAEQNKLTLATLTADPRFAPLRAKFIDELTAKDRLSYVTVVGPHLYNFWQDATHIRGIWRRTSLASYGSADTKWEAVIDLDRLDAAEHADWVWMGANCSALAYTRCLIGLSHGGKDAATWREFDLPTKSFVADGFQLPEAKSTSVWVDQDSLLLATDWGPGTLTSSGYPRQLRLWHRGTPWQDASLVFSGNADDMAVGAKVYVTSSGVTQIVEEQTTIFTSKRWLRLADGNLVPLPIPDDSEVEDVIDGALVLKLKTAWKAGDLDVPAGSVVTYDPVSGTAELVLSPSSRGTVGSVSTTRDGIVVEALEDVQSRLILFTRLKSATIASREWQGRELSIPAQGNATIAAADPFSSKLLLISQNFLSPPGIYAVDTSDSSRAARAQLLKQVPARFDASPYTFEQHFATSRDGTLVPYFMVHRRDLVASGANPTLLYGYGGFAIPLLPTYSTARGIAWLAKGGVYVLANIRGGGEFGPAWHEAAIKTNRQRAFDDFIAVAEDLKHARITDPAHLGIEGGSNGGLLVGTVMVERPDLFGAVLCEVPLLDMLRFPLLGAGASWEAEYGDPAVPSDRAALAAYSPYQNVQPRSTYPKPFFVTSTGDDRVTPAHARKMAAKMAAAGQPYLFYETAAGGHSTPSSVDAAATGQALQYVYLYQQLMR